MKKIINNFLNRKKEISVILAKCFLCTHLFILVTISYSQPANNFQLSLKCSYHTSDDPDSFEGFANGFLFGGNCDLSLDRKIYFSASSYYGKSTDDNFISYPNEKISRAYTFWGINGLLKYKEKYNRFSISIGLGLGNLNLKTTSKFGKINDSYLNLIAEISIGYFLHKDFLLELSVSNFNFADDKTKHNMFIIGLGPVIVLK